MNQLVTRCLVTIGMIACMHHRVKAQEFIPGTWQICQREVAQSARTLQVETDTLLMQVGVFEIYSASMPEEARDAILGAFTVWDQVIHSDVTIQVTLAYSDMSGSFLAQTRPSRYYRAFSHAVPDKVWYPVALAERIAGYELNASGDSDIEITINQAINWYFGSDGDPASAQYDLMSILLHEIAHGLGFLSLAASTSDGLTFTSNGSWCVYDLMLAQNQEARIYKWRDQFTSLLSAATGDNLWLEVPESDITHFYQVYAPSTFYSGVSISHWDDADPLSQQLLMIPYIAAGWVRHQIETQVIEILDALGWDGELQDRLMAFPNPAVDKVYLELPAAISTFTVRLFTSSGREVYSQKIENFSGELFEMDLSAVSDGVYILSVSTSLNSRSRSCRIIVVK